MSSEITVTVPSRSSMYIADVSTSCNIVFSLAKKIAETPSHFTFRAGKSIGSFLMAGWHSKRERELAKLVVDDFDKGYYNSSYYNTKTAEKLLDKIIFKRHFGDVDDFDVRLDDTINLECTGKEWDTILWFGVNISKQWLEEHCPQYQEFLSRI